MASKDVDELAKDWVSMRWEDLFPDLGSYDFAREAFKAGYATGRLLALTEKKASGDG